MSEWVDDQVDECTGQAVGASYSEGMVFSYQANLGKWLFLYLFCPEIQYYF